jgi:hypothetical protein
MLPSKTIVRTLSVALCAFTVGQVSAAHADYLKVYSPHIEKGELAAEVDLNYNRDHRDSQDGYFSQVLGMEYGINDYWMTELAAEIEKDANASDKLTNIKWENIISPYKPGELPIDTALYLELEKSAIDGQPNNFEAKVLLEKDSGKFVNQANIGVSTPFGGHSGGSINGSVALRTAYKLDQKFEPGIEYYADLGNVKNSQGFNQQNHQIGPVMQGKIGHVKYDTGVLFGVSSEAPDTTAKFNVEYEF